MMMQNDTQLATCQFPRIQATLYYNITPEKYGRSNKWISIFSRGKILRLLDFQQKIYLNAKM